MIWRVYSCACSPENSLAMALKLATGMKCCAKELAQQVNTTRTISFMATERVIEEADTGQCPEIPMYNRRKWPPAPRPVRSHDAGCVYSITDGSTRRARRRCW